MSFQPPFLEQVSHSMPKQADILKTIGEHIETYLEGPPR